MASDLSRFETLVPSRFDTFPIQNNTRRCFLRTLLLRVAVLDAPASTAADDNQPPRIAVLIVPQYYETEWMFCTESGHFQLLYRFNLSRLILIGNNPDPDAEPVDYFRPASIKPADMERIQAELKEFLVSLHPKECLPTQIQYVTCEDVMLYRDIMERYVGTSVGEFAVEEVVMGRQDHRRWLRFKAMPNVIQSQIRLVLIPELNSGKMEYLIDTETLVDPYLSCMVSGLFLIAPSLDVQFNYQIDVRALCLGVGGGSLLSFLNTQLGFHVVGVEVDEDVISAAKKHFGLNDEITNNLIVADAIEWISEAARDLNGLDAHFDVVMVDLVSNEARSRVTSPPQEFVTHPVFEALRLLLYDHGVLVIHVIPPNQLFYESFLRMLKDVFNKVYKIDVNNSSSSVLMATLRPVDYNVTTAFSEKLRSSIPGYDLGSIVEL